MMFEDEKSGKLRRVKTLLDQRAWAKAKTVTPTPTGDSKNKKDPVPASEKPSSLTPAPAPVTIDNQKPVAAEKESSAAPVAIQEQEGRAQNLLPEQLPVAPLIQNESTVESRKPPSPTPAIINVDEHQHTSADERQGEVVVEKAVVNDGPDDSADPSSSPINDDTNTNEPESLETNAPSVSDLAAPTPLAPLNVDDTHEDAPTPASSTLEHELLSSSAPPDSTHPVNTLPAQTGIAPSRTTPTKIATSTADSPFDTYFATTSVSVAQPVVEQNVPGQGTEEKQLTAASLSTKRKFDDASGEASKKQKADVPSSVSVVENTQRVEMRNPVTGQVLKIYNNAEDAALDNYIRVDKLTEICTDGGGLVGKRLYRFLDDEKLDTQASTSERETSTRPVLEGPISILPAALPRPPSTLIHRPAQPTHIVGRKSDDTVHAKVQKHFIPPFTRRNKRVLPLESGRVVQPRLAPAPQQPSVTNTTTNTTSAASAATTRPPKSLPNHFDLSTLLPIRRSTKPPLKPRRTIELVELRSLKVLVCFRGAIDAARALDIDRKAVTEACESYSKTRPLTFGTYTLRYAQPGHYSAYIYGDDSKDYAKHRKETHFETAARFKRIFEAKQKDETLGERPEYKTSSEKVDDLIADAVVDTEEVEINCFEGALDAFTSCLVCQKRPPSIVFEPCYHAVLCRGCAAIACKSFCPVCHTQIQGRAEPKMAILVRPRIFSAYSFM